MLQKKSVWCYCYKQPDLGNHDKVLISNLTPDVYRIFTESAIGKDISISINYLSLTDRRIYFKIYKSLFVCF